MAHIETDVLIIGTGPAGSATAALLSITTMSTAVFIQAIMLSVVATLAVVESAPNENAAVDDRAFAAAAARLSTAAAITLFVISRIR